MDKLPLEPVTPLKRSHDCRAFDCGYPELNSYLQKFAWMNQQAGAAKTYVMTRGTVVVGYHSLAYGSIEPSAATERVRKGLARHPIPVMVLARWAVHRLEQRQGIGKALLRHALERTVEASEIAGLRAIVVHAKDENARSIYEGFDFERSPTNEFHLMLLLKDIHESLDD